MGKKRSAISADVPKGNASTNGTSRIPKFDPTLADLFAKSAGPVERPVRSHAENSLKAKAHLDPTSDPEDEDEAEESVSEEERDEGEDEDAAEGDDALGSVSASETNSDDQDDESVEGPEVDIASQVADLSESDAGISQERKRKRKRTADKDGEIEDAYMRRLAREEEEEEAKQRTERASKRRKGESDETEAVDGGAEAEAVEDADEDSDEDVDDDIPQHESLAPSRDAQELEKSARTVFLSNVSTSAITDKSAKKELMRHMGSFVSSLPEHTPPHKVESIRFRSIAFASHIPKKAAYAKKEIMDQTTKSTNAYVVYSTQVAAREAARRLNGTVVLDRHLRVDEVAHPAKTDHKRCVFVGNLGFVDDENLMRAAEKKDGEKFKPKPPSDVEEGLWREFGKCGTVESVRVIRDPKTRVGKGFAYVQFTDENGVEAALLYNDKKFPPMLPRKLRVTRAKKFKKNAKPSASSTRPATDTKSNGVYRPKISSEEQSRLGRAGKLLGKAGAAQMKHAGKSGGNFKQSNGAFKAPESFVFEGHRASSKQGNTGLKFKGAKKNKKGGKPSSRSSKRGAAWKAAGGRKSGS